MDNTTVVGFFSEASLPQSLPNHHVTNTFFLLKGPFLLPQLTLSSPLPIIVYNSFIHVAAS